MRTMILAVILSISGCATCQRYPVACVAAGAIIGASIALSVGHTADPTHPPIVRRQK